MTSNRRLSMVEGAGDRHPDCDHYVECLTAFAKKSGKQGHCDPKCVPVRGERPDVGAVAWMRREVPVMPESMDQKEFDHVA